MGYFAMTIYSNLQARRWVCLLLLVLILPATGEGSDIRAHSTAHAQSAGHAEWRWSPADASIEPRGERPVEHAHAVALCGADGHFSASNVDQHGAVTMVGHTDCGNSNHPCQCPSGACAAPTALVAYIGMPLLAPATAHLPDSNFLPAVRRNGVRYRPPILI